MIDQQDPSASEIAAATMEPPRRTGAASPIHERPKRALIDIHRLLPQDADAEQGVLSSILLAPDYAFEKCDEHGILASSFHIPAHASIFGTLTAMHNERVPIDFQLLTARLRNEKILDQVGGPAFVTDLFTFLPTAANVGFYAGIMEEKATARAIIVTGTEFAARGYDEAQVTPLLDEFEARVLAISGARYQSGAGGIVEVGAKEGTMAAIHAIEALYERRGRISGLSTGFDVLDKLIDGLHPEDFMVIGARPSMGKTALLMDMALNLAMKGKRVAVFSAEMSAAQLYQRAVCSLARVNVLSVRDGLLSERDFPALTTAGSKLAGSKLVILDAVGASITAVRARARRLHRKAPLDAMFVDYLQKLRHPPQARNREREIAEVSEGLKTLQRELKIPLVTAAQLNRDLDKRGGKGSPRMSDLRESGCIEQDADVIALLDRPEQRAEDDEEKRELEGKATLDIVKQRSGPLGEVPLTFLKQFTRFESRAYCEPEPEPEKPRMGNPGRRSRDE